MKQTEQEPHELLRVLGRAKPRDGIEARIMTRVAEQREKGRLEDHRPSFWRPAFLGRAAFAVVVIALLACGLVLARWRSAGSGHMEVAMLPPPTAPAGTTEAPSVKRVLHQTAPRTVVQLVRSKLPTAPVGPLLRQRPLTEQERLLLTFAAAQKKSPSPALGDLVLTEVLEDHGLGKNALLELPHQAFQPIHYTQPGEIE